MKTVKLILAMALLLSVVLPGCSGGDKGGGGEATFDSCVAAYTQFYKNKSGDQMPADAIKQASEAACETCKQDGNACKIIVDNLKNQP